MNTKGVVFFGYVSVLDRNQLCGFVFRICAQNIEFSWKHLEKLNFFSTIILVTPDDMWTPFKQLQRVVETYLSKRAPDGSLATLELLLQKHKPDFINLCKNSVCLSIISNTFVIIELTLGIFQIWNDSNYNEFMLFTPDFSQKTQNAARKSKKASPMEWICPVSVTQSYRKIWLTKV